MTMQETRVLEEDHEWAPLTATITRVSALDALLAAEVLPTPAENWQRVSDLGCGHSPRLV